MGTLIRRLGPLLALGILAGCDLFKPADPEPPSGSVVIPVYTSPSRVLVTVAQALEDKARSNGQSAYVGSFADSAADGVGFHAFFDPLTVVRMAGQGVVAPDDWDLDDEDPFYSRFVTLGAVPASSQYLVQWAIDPTPGSDDSTADAATLHREYTVFAIQGTDAVTIARGLVTLTFARVSTNRWAITRWQDREAPGANIGTGEVCFGQRRLEP